MKRLVVVGLAVMGAIALASGAPLRAADEEPTTAPTVEKSTAVGRSFVDADGDGVCDNCTGVSRGQGQRQGQRAGMGNRGDGPRDGSGNQVGPRDGSGNQTGPRDGSGNRVGRRDGSGRGPGSSGQCDGTGPKGRRQGQGRRGGGRR
jgi:hypothetical protein